MMEKVKWLLCEAETLEALPLLINVQVILFMHFNADYTTPKRTR